MFSLVSSHSLGSDILLFILLIVFVMLTSQQDKYDVVLNNGDVIVVKVEDEGNAERLFVDIEINEKNNLLLKYQGEGKENNQLVYYFERRISHLEKEQSRLTDKLEFLDLAELYCNGRKMFYFPVEFEEK